MDFEAAYSKRFRTGNFLRQRELNLLHYSQVFMYHDLLWAKPESRFGKNHSTSLACWSKRFHKGIQQFICTLMFNYVNKYWNIV